MHRALLGEPKLGDTRGAALAKWLGFWKYYGNTMEILWTYGISAVNIGVFVVPPLKQIHPKIYGDEYGFV